MTRACNLALTGWAGLLALGLVGCGGGSRYAPVSGVVTLNGKPYRNAVVLFLPMASSDNPAPGRGASGSTDENGRFHLKSIDGEPGAAVGKNLVRITTRYSDQLKGYAVWDEGQHKLVKAAADPIPPEWNYQSTKEFDVPPGGTEAANFNIVAGKAP